MILRETAQKVVRFLLLHYDIKCQHHEAQELIILCSGHISEITTYKERQLISKDIVKLPVLKELRKYCLEIY